MSTDDILLRQVFRITEQGAVLSVRAKPGTSRSVAPRIVDIGDGLYALELAVPEAAQEGRANKALCGKVAALLGVPKRAVTLLSGERSRLKRLEIEGNPADLLSGTREILKQNPTKAE